MSSLDTRNVARDSLFLFAELTLEGLPQAARVKVRNLSAGGMMADAGGLEVSRGDRLTAELRTVGSVKGSVAWVQGERIGIAFETAIDPAVVRAPIVTDNDSPRYARPVIASPTHGDHPVRSI
ncbi:PilZ domain-containing protein [Qipengyuania sp. 6D47A]|uniref:PilZ domain-containing protein n=2 Tax=Qipengyuania qiaonensis TaxID=2867240 RepID=A0ABS7J2F7_9SPHN|nr:PilZ domain-containing protein [Qipengyuania qiaonensis]MBX7481496.1 PilZ domain-containing protein [Qipengyuania qiaonensis]